MNMRKEAAKDVYFALLNYKFIFATREKQLYQTFETHQIQEMKEILSRMRIGEKGD